MAEPLSKYLSRLLSAVLGFVSQACAYGAFGALLCGGGLFLRDLYHWAQTGLWDPERGWWLLQYAPQDFVEWLIFPDSWIGIHDLLVVVLLDRPLSIVVPVLVAFVLFVVAIVVYNTADDLKQSNQQRG